VNTTSRSTASFHRSSSVTARKARGASAVGAALLSLSAFGCSEALDAVDGGGEGFASIYESDQFQTCSGCHAPGAPGKVNGTEATQDWSTQQTANATLQGTASGLIGNFQACNGVPFIGPSAEQSLLVAVFDSDVRQNFENAQNPGCNADAITDETIRVGELPPSLLQDLKDWIDGGS
jgi:hypothetical protein